MFEPLPAQFHFPEAELRVLEFWQRQDIFARSLAIRRNGPRFIFYEGPPTANGLPHPGHCLTRAIKDLFPRYQTMCGKLVERKAGWDTHGLPVEVEVCKELDIHTKQEIEEYGLAKFVQRCIESVFRYTREWEEMTRRLGFWVNLEEAYVTYHQSYVESVWWSLKTLFERGLLYQGHKVVWWWAQGGTALSAGEVGEGYRTVEDPSVYVRFPLVRAEAVSRQPSAAGRTDSAGGPSAGRDDAASAPRGRRCPHDDLPADAKISLLVWTTTPWTLISNHFAAVGPDIDYSLVHDQTTDEYLYIATALVGTTAEKVRHALETVATCTGNDLVGRRYRPPFDCYFNSRPTYTTERGFTTKLTAADPPLGEYRSPLFAEAPTAEPRPQGGTRYTGTLRTRGEDFVGWRVLAADFVTLDTGTGIVHQAPAYGEVDFELWRNEARRFAFGLPLLNAVAPDGTLTEEAPAPYRGRWVKDCDAEIMRELKERGILYHREMVRHEYPFCPRAEDDALIQYARRSWFVRTSQFKEAFLRNNAAMQWLPLHIQEGRFGDFLRNNVDWALSRERYWGTPLPIWVCEKTGGMEAIGSLAELMAKPGATDGGLWKRELAAATARGESLSPHLRVHKPYIDAWTYDSPFDAEGTEARRHEGTKEGIEGSREQGSKGGTGVPPVDAGPDARPTPRRARMRRVSEVIDCWWDAGSMPFAQWGFPHAPDSVRTLAERFPANFISEAIDQTRGWFYGLLSISTLLFGKAPTVLAEAGMVGPQRAELGRVLEPVDRKSPWLKKGVAERLLDDRPGLDYPMPYRTCIVLGHVMGEDGLKMSKRSKNYKEPSYIFDHYGADAMRWFFYSAQTPWTSIRFQEANIRDAQREFLLRLYHVFSFFNIYANIDGFALDGDQGIEGSRDRGTGWRPVGERSELDRWIVSELHRTIRFVREKMDAFENYPAAGRLNEFVDALSNWYVRRSRERFWQHDQDAHKWDAYNTLYEVLLALSKLLAPFTPFFAEVMYRNLTGQGDPAAPGAEPAAAAPAAHTARIPAPLSVHLCDYPVAEETLIDEKLAQEMELVRDIVSLGRAARTDAKLKVRQPLALAEIILARPEHGEWLAAHADLIADELNLKQIEFTGEADHYVRYRIRPDFKALGPKFGPIAPKIAAALGRLDAAEARRALVTTGELRIDVDGQPIRLSTEEVQVRLEARPGWSAAQGRAGVVVVKTELTEELRDEGLMRELIHQVQALRKEQELPYEARIAVYLEGPAALLAVVRRFSAAIQRECLAARLEFSAPPAGEMRAVRIESQEARLAIARL